MRLRVCALFPALWFPFFCFGQQPEGSLVPREIFVGDTGIFTYAEKNLPASFPAEPGGTEIPVEQVYGSQDAVTVRKIRILPAEEENVRLCEVTFVPWETGEVRLPGFFLDPEGRIRSSEVRIPVASLSERLGIQTLSADRPPMLAPGTLYLLYAFLFGFAGISVAAFRIARRLLRKPDRRDGRLPVGKLRREFAGRRKKLERDIRRLEPSVWYGNYSAAVRLFFCRVTGCGKWAAASARELETLLVRWQDPDADSRDASLAQAAGAMQKLLFKVEEIRFSGRPSAGPDLRKESLDAFARLIAAVLAACPLPADEGAPQ